MIRKKAASAAATSPDWVGSIVAPQPAAIVYNVITGTENSEAISGTAGDDHILGLGGSDEINGLGGNDLLEGGEGVDLLDGGAGDDILHGGPGTDFLDDYDSGYDQLFGDEGDDYISVNHWPEDTGDIFIDGGTGDDDIIVSLSDSDHSSHNRIFGGEGHDIIHAQGGGSGVTTAIDAGAGNDYVAALRLSSGAPAYTITLGQGADLLSAVAGGTAGSVTVTDFEVGDTGDSLLLVSSLTSRLIGWDRATNPFALGYLRLVQNGADTLFQIDLNGATGGASFITYATLQNVTAAALTARNLGGFASDGSVAPGQTIAGTADPDTLSGTMSADTMTGGDGNDHLYGSAGNDVIEGGEGRDDLYGELGDDVLRGEGGSDSLWGGDTGNDQLFGGDAADQLFVTRLLAGTTSATLMDGGAGNDRLNFTSSVFGHSTIMRGGDDNDYFDVRANGASVEIDGGAGADLLYVDADEGNSYDITLGGAADTINLYAPSKSSLSAFDVDVTDFAVGAGGDKLVLTSVLTYYADGWDGATNPFAAGYLRLVQSGDDTILQIDRTGSAFGAFFVNIVTLEDLDRQSFTADNFGGFTPNLGNVAPVLSAPGTTAFSESVNGPPASLSVASSLTLTDADDIVLAGATVAITSGFQAGEDSLSFANTLASSFGNIAASYDAASGVLTLASADATATVGQWQNALRSVRYSNSSEEPDGATRTVSFSASDGQLTSAVATRDLTVTARNDSPAGASDTLTIDEDSVFTFDAAHFGFSDIDGDPLASVRISPAPTGGRIFFDADAGGPNSPVQIMGFPATFSAADIAAGKLTFVPTVNLNGTAAASVRFQVIDNGGGSNMDPTPNMLTFNLTPVDDPIVGTPGPDRLDGTPNDDVIQGLGGDDWIEGLGGNDRLEGGEGHDTLVGGTGDDLLYGGEGVDVLDDVSGNDQLYGEGGSDSLSAIRNEGAPAGVILMDGGAGEDFLSFFSHQFADDVTMIGGADDDQISAFRGLDVTIDAGSGRDKVALNFLGADYTITLGSGSDVLSLPARFEPATRVGSIVVTDFETGEQGDRVELLTYLASVLQGWDIDANPFATQHLRLVQDGADVVLQVDEDGTAGGADFADLVRFENRAVAAFTQHNMSGYPADGGQPTQTSFIGTAARDIMWGSFGDDLIQGLGGADEIYGGAGDDRIEGGDAPDSLNGQLGNDVLLGGAGNDNLFDGSGGNDELYGEGGADRMFIIRNEPLAVSNVLMDGGDDNDAIVFSSYLGYGGTATLIGGAGNDDLYSLGGRFITFDGGTGDDYVEIVLAEGPYTVTLGAGYDQLVVAGILRTDVGPLPDLNITVTDFAPGEFGPATDVLFLRDYLDAVLEDWDEVSNLFETGHLQLVQAGADTLLRIDEDGYAGTGGAREFIRFQDVTASSLTAYNLNGFVSGTFDLVGTPGGETLQGSWGMNRLEGLGGNDILNGGAGADTMFGGAGDDFYHVDSLSDQVIEMAGEGFDIVYTSTHTILAAGSHVEVLWAAVGGLTLTGNELANDFWGSSDGDTLNGGGGDDGMLGGAGNDTLNGGIGADGMYGGAGDDFYYVDNAGDRAFEQAGEGGDIVYASTSYALEAGSHVEVLWAAAGGLTLTGNELANDLWGSSDGDTLNGGGGNDGMSGAGGNDILNGGTGADGMYGGAGDDFYYVDNVGDRSFELAGEGFDIVYASTSYTLEAGSHVEALSAQVSGFTLTGNELANDLWGSSGGDTLNGGGGNDGMSGAGGNDILNGGIGADGMYGGAGDDFYYVDNAGDRSYEQAGEGTDIVYAFADYTLETGSHIDILWAAVGGLTLTGNEIANSLWGSSGADALNGGGGDDGISGADGADTLNGGAGNDYLSGGGGADKFAFTTALGAGNVDTIADYDIADDILLDDAVFTGLALGALDPNAFVAGTAAQDGGDRIIYDAGTGTLYFDADGSGAGAAVLFATIQPGTALNASEFTVI